MEATFLYLSLSPAPLSWELAHAFTEDNPHEGKQFAKMLNENFSLSIWQLFFFLKNSKTYAGEIRHFYS